MQPDYYLVILVLNIHGNCCAIWQPQWMSPCKSRRNHHDQYLRFELVTYHPVRSSVPAFSTSFQYSCPHCLRPPHMICVAGCPRLTSIYETSSQSLAQPMTHLACLIQAVSHGLSLCSRAFMGIGWGERFLPHCNSAMVYCSSCLALKTVWSGIM